MKKGVFLVFISFAVGTYLITHHRQKAAEPSLREAKDLRPFAPEFVLTDLAGQKLDLDTYRGKIVLLNFWATWCAPCRAEIPRFVALQHKYHGLGLRIIGISLDDDPKSAHAFLQEFKINYPVAIGDAELAQRYGGILGLPVSFLIGFDGRINVKYAGETDVFVIEQEVKRLLEGGQ